MSKQKELCEKATLENLLSPEMLKLSQEVDKEIVEEMKRRIHNGNIQKKNNPCGSKMA